MRFLIVDQCSGRKSYRDTSPVFDIGAVDAASREALLDRQEVAGKAARNLYDGRQQAKIDSATDTLREEGHEVDRYFISAGFGLIGEREQLPPYEATFKDMTTTEIRERSRELSITNDLCDVITDGEHDVVVLALGSDYYDALTLEAVFDRLPAETMVLLFNAEETAATGDNVVSVPARTEQAGERGVIVVELKGHYLQTLADNLATGRTIESPDDLRQFCLEEPQQQTGFDQF